MQQAIACVLVQGWCIAVPEWDHLLCVRGLACLFVCLLRMPQAPTSKPVVVLGFFV